MRRLIDMFVCLGILFVGWCASSRAASAAGETVKAASVEASVETSEAAGPILVGHESQDANLAALAEPAIHAGEALPLPALPATALPSVTTQPHLVSAAKPVAAATRAPVVTDVIMLIDATHSMAWPSGRERRMAIAQWSALDIADGVPENIPAAFVALHDEATALRQLLPLTSDGRGHLRRTVMRLVPAGEGKIDKLLVEARRLLANKPEAVPLIVLATDGVDCDPFSHGAPIRDLAQAYGDRLYFQVIGVGDNHVISAKLRDLANQGGRHGEYSSVKSHAELPTALSRCRELFEQIGAERAAFAQRQAADLAQCCTDRTSLQTRVEQLEQANATLGRELKLATASVAQLTQEKKDLTRERSELSDQVVVLKSDVEKLQRDNVDLVANNKRLEIEKSRLTAESASRLADVNRLKDEKHAVELSRDGYRRAYWTWLILALAFLALLILASLLWWFRTIRLLDQLGIVTRERDELSNDFAGQTVKLEEAREEIRCLEHKLAESRDRSGDLQGELDRSRDDCERINDEKRRLKCELDESETRRHELTRELDRCRDECGDLDREQAALKLQIDEMGDRYKRLKRKHEELEQQAAASHHEVDQTRQSLSECRTQAGRLEERLDACHQSKGDRDRRIHELEHLVSASREEAQRLSEKLRCCHERNEQHSQELLRASTAGAAAESRADHLERALHECQRHSLHVSASAATARAEQEAAFAATLGATREMAANSCHHGDCHGHDHGSCQPPVIVTHHTPYHSTVTPNGPVMGPNTVVTPNGPTTTAPVTPITPSNSTPTTTTTPTTATTPTTPTTQTTAPVTPTTTPTTATTPTTPTTATPTTTTATPTVTVPTPTTQTTTPAPVTIGSEKDAGAAVPVPPHQQPATKPPVPEDSPEDPPQDDDIPAPADDDKPANDQPKGPPDGKKPKFPIQVEEGVSKGYAWGTVDATGSVSIRIKGKHSGMTGRTRFSACMVITGWKDGKENVILAEPVTKTTTIGADFLKGTASKDQTHTIAGAVKPEDIDSIRNVRLLLGKDVAGENFKDVVKGMLQAAKELVTEADALYKEVKKSDIGKDVALIASVSSGAPAA